MTTEELHEILDNPQRKLTLAELQQTIYELKQNALGEWNKALEHENLHIGQFYCGENNAFQICLDLLEHLKGADNEQREAD